LVAGAVDGLKPDDVVLVLDPVAVQAAPVVLPFPPDSGSSHGGLRAMVVVLGLVLSVLASALLVVVFRMRKKTPEPALNVAPPAPPSSPKPVIAPGVQRKVA
jgi:hypothetical protein